MGAVVACRRCREVAIPFGAPFQSRRRFCGGDVAFDRGHPARNAGPSVELIPVGRVERHVSVIDFQAVEREAGRVEPPRVLAPKVLLR